MTHKLLSGLKSKQRKNDLSILVKKEQEIVALADILREGVEKEENEQDRE